MSDTVTARRWTIRQFTDTDVPDPVGDKAATMAKAYLRETIRQDGYVIDADTITPGTPQAIVLADNDAGWEAWTGRGYPDGHITEWSATATERHRDGDAVGWSRIEEDGALSVDVPAPYTAHGGGLRVRHDLGGPVTVTAYREDGTGIGYLFAQDIDEMTEHVELLPGAARLRVVRDPDEEA